MQPRMKSPAMILPGAYDALQALQRSLTENGNVPRATLELVYLRAGQINGCGVCVDLHSRMMRKLGEKAERISCVSAWREAPYFSEAERAALALAEAASRLSDRADPVPDEVWEEAARQFNETQLAALVMAIGMINLWNRLNVTTRQVGGEFLQEFVERHA